MKRTLFLGALTGIVANVAHAQSSASLYGLIDAGITYSNNQGGHAAWQETSGSVNGSRWGLRGAEDLGGGLKAIFTLENGFGINNGTFKQNGREFGRQAFVGLTSEQFGGVTLGRQYDSVVDYVGPLALTGTSYGGTQFAHPFDNDNLDNSFRINNAVKYTSVNYSGLKFGGLYGFSNAAGQFANNRAYSFGASYSFGGLYFAAAYMEISNDLNALNVAASAPGAVAGDASFTAGRQRTWGAGLSYKFGPAVAGFVFTQTRLSDADAVNNAGGTVNLRAGSSLRFNNYEVNSHYNLTSALSIAGNYTYTDGKLNNADPKWHQFDLAAVYSLSRRTDAYVQAEYQRVIATGTPFTAVINGLNASSNDKQVAVTVGLRHRF